MRIRTTLAASLCVLLGCTGAVARVKTSPVAVIPFRETAGHIYVTAAIGESRDLAVMIDTGASETVLSKTVYTRLGLPFAGMVNLPPGFGGRSANPAEVTTIPSLALGGLAIRNISALVLPLEFIQAGFGVKTDAVLGADLFNRYVVELDYPKRVLRVYDPASYHAPKGGCKLALHLRTYPLIDAQIIGSGGTPIDAVVFLDTGSQIPMLTRSFTASHPDLLAYSEGGSQQGQGAIGSTTKFRVGRVPAIRLGDCTIRNPMVGFSEDATGLGATGAFSATIGLSVFRNFTTIFDYPQGFVIFQGQSKVTSASK